MHLDFGRIPGGYGWVFPKKDGLSLGVGGVSRGGERVNPYSHFKDFVRGLNYIKAGKNGRAIGHPILSFYDEGQRVAQGRVLLVGDAGHLMDPLTGEGIYYALQSGKLAAEAIVESKERGISPSQPYEMSVRTLIFGDLKWALHISQIIYRFTKFSYRTLKLHPELGEICIRVMEQKETYQGFVLKVKDRMKGLLKGHLREKIKNALARA
jgi:flavin-dependent dehydrogenase